MKNVLVFPCGSEIGLEISRALAQSKHFKIIGANSIDDHGKYVYEHYITNVPFIEEENFIQEINKIIKEYSIDYIIPAHDSAILKFSKNSLLVNAPIITSPLKTCQITRSKKETYDFFKNIIATPKVYKKNVGLTFPVFLKPDVGQGSKGTYKVNTEEELEFYIKKDSTLLALEYLPGKEYTIDCFTNKNGILLFAEGRERNRISNGISVNSKPIKNPEFQKIASKINNALPFQGVWFFQLKERENGELVLMEISPRIAGTMALYRVIGINFIQLSLFDKMGYDVRIINNKLDIEIDRALFSRYEFPIDYNTIYIDLDDTIIIGNSTINTTIIKFIYQARNLGKKIILITKHKLDVETTLNQYAISSSLFNEIIIIEQHQKKSDFIKDLNSIFIDDSFQERIDVFENLKIPVFDIDAVESLLTWKS